MSDRPLRADARRKREQILTAATAEVGELAARARAGETARLSLEGVAARAGVGIGTLYRHFPTREALIEAVYREELAHLCAAVEDLLAHDGPAHGEPMAALRAWMGRYLDFVDSKRAMGEGFRGLVATGVVTSVEARSRLAEAMARLLDAAAGTGAIRVGVDPGDVVAAMAGAAFAAAGDDPRAQAERLLDLLVDGLRA